MFGLGKKTAPAKLDPRLMTAPIIWFDREAVIKRNATIVINELEPDFIKRTPRRFAPGDKVMLDPERQSLFGGWEIMPKENYLYTGDLKVISLNEKPCRDYAYEKLTHYMERSDDYDEVASIPDLREIMKRKVTVYGDPFYWKCHVDHPNFKYSIPEIFLLPFESEQATRVMRRAILRVQIEKLSQELSQLEVEG